MFQLMNQLDWDILLLGDITYGSGFGDECHTCSACRNGSPCIDCWGRGAVDGGHGGGQDHEEGDRVDHVEDVGV